MTFIVVDPFLVILSAPCNIEQLDNFVEGLLDWSEAISREDIPIFVSENCLNALYEDGWFPFDDRLHQLIKELDIDYLNEETITDTVRTIFNREPRLEESLDIRDFSHDVGSLLLDPDLLITRLGKCTSEALKKTLINILISELILRNIQPECFFATSKSPLLFENEKLHVSVNVQMVEKTDLTILEVVSPNLQNDLTISFGYQSILKRADFISLWGNAAETSNITDAIERMIIIHRDEGLPPGRKEFHVYRVGNHFLESIHIYGFHARFDWARVLIDSCARIILGIPKSEVIEFREDDRPQSAQRVRRSDDALAWRTHLTKGNEGFRLMFWTTEDGVIEFANIGPKKELVIYE